MNYAVKVRHTPADRRLTPRGEVSITCVLRIGNGDPLDARLIDLTREGCRFSTQADVPNGAEVAIGLAHIGRVFGQVVWRNGAGEYGCAFEHLLPAGAITAVHGGSNVVRMAGLDTAALHQSDKLPGSLQLAVIGTLAFTTWVAVVSIAAYLLA